MIQIGDKIRCRPAATYDHSTGFPDELHVEVEGTVEYINEKHHYFRVSYPLPGCDGHECFKFNDNGGYYENNGNSEPKGRSR